MSDTQKRIREAALVFPDCSERIESPSYKITETKYWYGSSYQFLNGGNVLHEWLDVSRTLVRTTDSAGTVTCALVVSFKIAYHGWHCDGSHNTSPPRLLINFIQVLAGGSAANIFATYDLGLVPMNCGESTFYKTIPISAVHYALCDGAHPANMATHSAEC